MSDHHTKFNTLDERGDLVIMRRSAASYSTVEEIASEAKRLTDLFPSSVRGHKVLVRDLRDVMGNSNPTLDEARNRHNGAFFRGWRYVVALLKTEVGRLHAIRAFQAMGVECTCYTDEAEALAAAEAFLS
ncbi:MAG: hypothetical protein AB8H86_19020 [Polyangiales bacterium]